MKMPVISLFAALCVLGAAGAPSSVAAAPQNGVRLYHDGIEAYGAGNVEAAREFFEGALRELPNGHQLLPLTYYNLGRIAEQQGDACTAARRLGDYLQVVAPADATEQRRVERARTDRESQQSACGASTAEAGEQAAPVSSGVVVGLSLAEGVLVYNKVQRTHIAPELTAGYRWGGLLTEMALAATVESPATVIFRPGARLDMVEVGQQSATYVRAAGQFMATPVATSGVLLAPGARIGLGGSWALTVEVDASLWFVAPSVVPLELRLGVQHAF